MDLQNGLHPRFRVLRSLIKFAALLGVVQSLIWIGFAITGILAYYCIFDFSNIKATYASISELSIFEIYFNGSCSTDRLSHDYFTVLKNDNLTLLSPSDINICLWVYLVVNWLWLMSSAALLRDLEENHLRRLNILLYVWIFITMDITALDLGLGVVFGIDYGVFSDKSSVDITTNQNFDAVAFAAAKVASITMLIMALKGFILWITNACLAIYFFIETFSINEAEVLQTSLVSNDVISDTHSVKVASPISAYEARNPHQGKHLIRLNTEALERANKASIMSLKERHANKENMYANRFRQYTPRYEPNVPDPDYTPPMPRAKIFHGQNGHLSGNTRF